MEQYQQTATGTARHALQLPDEALDSTVVNLDLTCENIGFPINIGELIRRERHADIYSVYSSARDTTIEARAFVIDGVAGKLKRHRKRCIQRLGPRTLLSVSCRGAEIIVYTANHNDWLVTAEEDNDSNETCRSVLVPTGKTSYKREAARIRQRERRRRTANQEHSSSPKDAELVTDGTPSSEDLADTFGAIILLYIFIDKKCCGRPFEALNVPTICMRSSWLLHLYSLLCGHGPLPSKLGVGAHQAPNADNCLWHEILQYFEDVQTQISSMSYRQLFTALHSVLLTLSPSDIRSVPSSNHQFDIIQFIQTTLPILIYNFKNMSE